MMNFSLERKDVNHIYYNATFTNNSALPIAASIIDTRSDPIIQTPEDFEMSIIRFDVSALTVPITVAAVVDPGNLNPAAPGTLATPNLFATLSFSGVDYTSNVQITPSSSFATVPLGSIFNFQKLLDDINAAYAASYALIPMPPMGSFAPQFIWNPVTSLIELYVSADYIYASPAPPIGTPTIQIWASFGLWEFLTGFNNFQNGIDRVDRKDVEIEVRQTTALIQPAVGLRTGIPYSLLSQTTIYKVQQEAQQDQNWNDARSLLITTSMIPIRPEYVPTNFTTNNNSVSTATQRILSDFLIPADENVLQSRNVFQYLPTAEYRMVDLYGRTPFSTIDLQMLWTTYEGDTFPLMLDPGSSLSVKILFRRKGITD